MRYLPKTLKHHKKRDLFFLLGDFLNCPRQVFPRFWDKSGTDLGQIWDRSGTNLGKSVPQFIPSQLTQRIAHNPLQYIRHPLAMALALTGNQGEHLRLLMLIILLVQYHSNIRDCASVYPSGCRHGCTACFALVIGCRIECKIG